MDDDLEVCPFCLDPIAATELWVGVTGDGVRACRHFVHAECGRALAAEGLSAKCIVCGARWDRGEAVPEWGSDFDAWFTAMAVGGAGRLGVNIAAEALTTVIAAPKHTVVAWLEHWMAGTPTTATTPTPSRITSSPQLPAAYRRLCRGWRGGGSEGADTPDPAAANVDPLPPSSALPAGGAGAGASGAVPPPVAPSASASVSRAALRAALTEAAQLGSHGIILAVAAASGAPRGGGAGDGDDDNFTGAEPGGGGGGTGLTVASTRTRTPLPLTPALLQDPEGWMGARVDTPVSSREDSAPVPVPVPPRPESSLSVHSSVLLEGLESNAIGEASREYRDVRDTIRGRETWSSEDLRTAGVLDLLGRLREGLAARRRSLPPAAREARNTRLASTPRAALPPRYTPLLPPADSDGDLNGEPGDAISALDGRPTAEAREGRTHSGSRSYNDNNNGSNARGTPAPPPLLGSPGVAVARGDGTADDSRFRTCFDSADDAQTSVAVATPLSSRATAGGAPAMVGAGGFGATATTVSTATLTMRSTRSDPRSGLEDDGPDMPPQALVDVAAADDVVAAAAAAGDARRVDTGGEAAAPRTGPTAERTLPPRGPVAGDAGGGDGDGGDADSDADVGVGSTGADHDGHRPTSSGPPAASRGAARELGRGRGRWGRVHQQAAAGPTHDADEMLEGTHRRLAATVGGGGGGGGRPVAAGRGPGRPASADGLTPDRDPRYIISQDMMVMEMGGDRGGGGGDGRAEADNNTSSSPTTAGGVTVHSDAVHAGGGGRDDAHNNNDSNGNGNGTITTTSMHAVFNQSMTSDVDLSELEGVDLSVVICFRPGCAVELPEGTCGVRLCEGVAPAEAGPAALTAGSSAASRYGVLTAVDGDDALVVLSVLSGTVPGGVLQVKTCQGVSDVEIPDEWCCEGCYAACPPSDPRCPMCGRHVLDLTGTRVGVNPDVVRPRFGWGCLKKGDTGVLRSVTPASECLVAFPRHPGDYRAAIADLVLLPPRPVRPGARIATASHVTAPFFGWGAVRREDTGRVVARDGEVLRAAFPTCPAWRCLVTEVVVLEDDGGPPRR